MTRMMMAVGTLQTPPPPPPGVGDRNPDRHLQYPTPAFVGNGGNVWNIKTSFGAVGDGVHDDTAAFVAAYDATLEAFDAGGWTTAGPNNPFGAAHTIYIPHGVYLVSNTIIYTGTRTVGGFEGVSGIRFQGESRSGTIIKLANNAAGFGSPSSPKPVLSLQKMTTNPLVSRNQLRDFTIDLGVGNSGAIGISWTGANLSEMRDLEVRGDGFAGIELFSNPTHSYCRDIVVDGCRHGIRLNAFGRGSHVCWEFVTLANQTVSGVEGNFSFSSTFRSLWSKQTDATVPAIRCTNTGMHLVVLDSRFDNTGSIGGVGVALSAGQMFLRNCDSSGYGAIATGVSGDHISEYHNGPLFRHADSTRTTSLNLPIQDPPEIPYDAPADWARPEDYGSVQGALNSGKPTVYLPARSYSVGSLNVPATVKRIIFMHGGVGGAWHVNQASATPVLFEDNGSGGTTYVDADRPVEVSHMSSWKTLWTGSPRTLFIENGWGFPASAPARTGVTAFVRATDQEVNTLPFVINGGTSVVLGWKAEQANQPTTFDIKGDARVEILGGNQGVRPPANIISIANSMAAVVFASCGFGEVSGQNFIRDVEPEGTTVFQGQQLVARPCIAHSGSTVQGATCPLYLTP